MKQSNKERHHGWSGIEAINKIMIIRKNNSKGINVSVGKKQPEIYLVYIEM